MLLDYALENDEDAIINDTFISTLFQTVQNNKYNNAKQKFEDVKAAQKMPAMDKYDEEVNSLSDMEEEKFDSFIKDLKVIKKKEGIIPEKYCDYLIKQKINSNSYLNQKIDLYFPIFKRVFEDKTRHVLMKNEISYYCVQITPNLDATGKFSGIESNGLIRLDENKLKNLSENNINMIETLFHEVKHAVQRKRLLLDKKVSANEYKMLKEEIIINENPKYYNKNYWFIYDEIDARIAGRKETYKYLKYLGLSNKKILDIESKDFFECFRENQRLERNDYKEAKNKNVIDENEMEKKEEFYVTFDRIIKKKPELIKEYSILSIEYNDEGRRRAGFELLKSYENPLNKYRENPENGLDNRLSLIPYILNESIISYETVMEDVEELLEYKTEDKIVKKYRDLIITKEIFGALRQCKDKRKFYVYDDDSDEDKTNHFNKLVGNLYEFAKRNPTEDVSQTILKEIEEFIPKENKEIECLKNIDDSVSASERQSGWNAIKTQSHENDINNNEEKKLKEGLVNTDI